MLSARYLAVCSGVDFSLTQVPLVLQMYSLGKDCSLFIWRCSHALEDALAELEQMRRAASSDEESSSSGEEERSAAEPPRKRAKTVPGRNLVPLRWSLKEDDKHLFIQEKAHIACSAFHKERNLLVIGFSNGVFSLYDMPEFNQIHSLTISQQKVSSVAINSTGDWLAFGCRSRGQLLVWEWASESYLMKQQGHFYDMSCLAYSPDGQYLATGGDDSKVKIWNTLTGFCFVTFTEHTGGVSAVQFVPNGKAVISASLDGTVRAFDLHRYRNFRTFASPRPAQFSCLALDSSGELVCAGSHDTFEVFVWSMQTGRLLELLSGHEGPVSGVAFQPSTAQLVSCSWDKTVRTWDVLNRSSAQETIQVNSDAVALAFRQDGHQFAVSTLDGTITFFDMNCKQQGSIEGRRDLGGGRRATDMVTAKHTAGGKTFTDLCYTADGSCLLAGGRSKFVCIYNVAQQALVKKFVISRNRSFDGMSAFLNSANMTEFGPLDLIDHDSDSDQEKQKKTLPGVAVGDKSSRRTKPEIRTKSVQFSPTGRAWAAASTEGLLIYSLDASVVFDPIELDVDVTVSRICSLLDKGEMLNAVVMSLRLNEIDMIQRVIETVPADEVEMLCRQLPAKYAELLLKTLGGLFETSRHLQFYLTWSGALLRAHARTFKEHCNTLMPALQSLHKAMAQKHEDVEKLCDDNMYTMQYLGHVAKLKYTPKEDGEGEGDPIVNGDNDDDDDDDDE
ncbi:periodic tryptophan protein 2 homolog [Sycon ciliatum]|uniref:periodic tryptophan protein 2 homolog n=1 Tax=Sycon ciliatum TaxID=27933 RepID=UPI0031F664F0